MFDTNFKKMSNIVNYNNGISYFINTNNTFDAGLETMIFKSENQPETNKESEIDFSKINWTDLYCERHNSSEAAITRHLEIVNNIGKYLDD